MRTNERNVAKPGRQLFTTVLTLVAFVVAGLLVAIGFSLRQSRAQVVRNGRQATANLARVLEEQNASTEQASDLILTNVLDIMNTIPPKAPARDAEIYALLREKVVASHFIRAIWMRDEKGDMVYDSVSFPTVKNNNSHQDYFQRLRAAPDPGLIISPPPPRDRTVVMTVNSRRVSKANGAFGGVISAAVSPKYYQDFYNSIDVGPHGLIAMFLNDGTLVTCGPADQRMIGHSFAGDPLFRRMNAAEKHGTFRAANFIDDTARIYSYRTVPHSSLIVVVGLSEDDLLADWRRTAKYYGFVALGFFLSIAGLTFFLFRQSKQLLQREASLAAAQRIAHFGNWETELRNREDVNSNPLFWTDETYRIFGYEPGSVSVTNDLFFQAVPPEDQPLIMHAVAAAIAEQQPYSFTHRIRRPDGEERIVHEIAEFVDGKGNGRLAKLIGTVHDITEQTRAEEQLRFQALLLSQVRNAVVATDLTGKIIYWNNFAEALYQWKTEEVIGRNVAEVTTPSESQTATEEVMSEIREKGSWQGEWGAQRKDGSAFTASVTNALFRWAGGDVAGIVGVSTDITEHKRAEEERLQREQEFEALVENAPDIISRYDRRFQHLYVNRAITQVTGLPASAFIGKTHEELGIPPNMQADWHAILEDVFASGKARETEYGFETPGGTRYYHSRLVPERAPDGRIHSVLNVARDITESKQAEEALRASEEQFANAFENAPIGMALIDPTGRLLAANASLCDLLGYSSAEMSGLTIQEVTHPDDLATGLENMRRLLAGESHFHYGEKRYFHKQGHLLRVRLSLSLIRDSEGRPQHFIAQIQDITAQREAQEHLEQSAALLRIAGKAARLGGWTIDLPDRVLTWSDENCAIHDLPSGYSPTLEEGIGFYPPEYRAEITRYVEECAQAGTAYDIELPRITSKGRQIWVRSIGEAVRDDKGRIVRLQGAFQDITERKQADEMLRQKNALIRIAGRVTRTGGWAVEMSESRVFWSDEVFDILEYPHDYVPSLAAALAVYPEPWRDKISEALETSARDGVSFDFEAEVITFKGRRIWVRVCGEAEGHADGSLKRVQGALQNITERRQTERALQESEAELRALAESMPQMVWMARPDGENIYFNQRWVDYTGLTLEESYGDGWITPFHPDDRPRAWESWQRAVAGGEYSLECRLRGADGGYRWMLIRGLPYRDAEGQVVKWMGTCTDIDDMKQIAEALGRANDDLETRVEARTQALQWAMEEAERANAAKSEFLSRMSHELRTPMNSILGFAQIMEMDAPTEAQGVRLGHIMKAGRHLLQLINEVLDTARVEAGHLRVSPEPVSLSGVLRMATELIRPLSEPRGQRLVCDWEAWEPLYVKADQQRLSQVMINLLSNATKYNRDDGVILVKCEQTTQGRIRVSVSDSGAGIRADQIEKLFRPFERLGAAFGPIEGTGLGLVLSKRLVELMGGTIGVESVVGVGSTFWVELPLAESPLQSLAALPETAPLNDAGETRHRVLYIEDNDANLQVVQHLLSTRPQYELLTATGGLEGLQLACSACPALILLDLHLPDLSGDEVLVRLRADPLTRDIPTVIVSADATPRQIRRLLAAGATEYLTKPLDMPLFLDVLQRLVPQKEASNV